MKRFMTAAFGLLAGGTAVAQHTQASEQTPWDFSGYAESYFIHDRYDARDDRLPGFIYSHNRTDRPKINLALAKVSYSGASVRGNLGLADGTYMAANYAAESGFFQHVYEANLGVRLSSARDLWLDVGVLPSHIGFESAIGRDNPTLTRSLAAENSPYFETGAKLTHTSASGRWTFSGLVLTGWQRIEPADGNSSPSFGHQLICRPNERITLNSSSFIGNDQADEQRRRRYFHNLYGSFQLSDRWSLTAGFDIGAEQTDKGRSSYNSWLTPVVIARFSPTEKFALAVRAEYYEDRNGVIVSSAAPEGFEMFACSVNADYRLTPRLLLRGELRTFDGEGGNFAKDDGSAISNGTVAVLSFAVSL